MRDRFWFPLAIATIAGMVNFILTLPHPATQIPVAMGIVLALGYGPKTARQ